MRRRRPKRRMFSLHEFRCVDGGKMTGRTMLEEHEAPITASIELAEQREIELGLDRLRWFGVMRRGGRLGATCGRDRLRVLSARRFGALDQHRLHAVSAHGFRILSWQRPRAPTAHRFRVELSRLIDDYANSAVATARREILITRIGNRRILRFRNRRFLEEIRIPARSLELVSFPKAGKTIAERDVLALTTKRCLSLHHDQMRSLTPS